MRTTFIALSSLACVLAAPTSERRLAAPSVTVKNGTITGSTTGTIDTFNGIPFAQPPVGNLRLKAPQSLQSGYAGGTFNAVGVPKSCAQFLLQGNTSDIASSTLAYVINTPLFQGVSNAAEDCLTLNVQRPSTATSTSKLPVVVWIYGGGFEVGSTQMYDASPIIRTSIDLASPVLYVAMNYRLGGFGFLAGKELQADGSTNLGLRDQRLALQWVAENIAAFGGDPDKVTIWGESAGSISVYDHTVIHGGDHTYNGKALFRGAIMNSGTFVPAENVAHSKPQAIYNQVVANAGCSGAADTLACLRTVDYTTFVNAANSLPGIFSYSSLNLAYLPRPDPADNFFSVSPEVSLYNGAYAKVPVIVSDQEDEGTLFSLVQENITTTAQVQTYIKGAFPETSQEIVNGFVATYPDVITAGSPFRTGVLNSLYPQFKRLAALFGDVVFTLRRRQYLDVVSGTVPAWSLLDSHDYGVPVLGTFHASDVLEYYYGPYPSITNAAKTYREAYISFFNFLDPNAISAAAPSFDWPKYTSASPQLLHIEAVANSLLADTFRSSSSNFLKANPTSFRT